MRRSHRIVVSICVVGLLSVLQAQAEQQTVQPGASSQHLEGAVQSRTQQVETPMRETRPGSELTTAGLFRASKLLGMEVRSRENQKIGEIQDLTIDAKSGRISYAAISSGGILGMGNKLVAVPWNSLHLRAGVGERSNESYALLNVPKQDFDKAPPFAEDKWPTSQDQIWQVGTEDEQMDTSVEPQTRQEPSQHGTQHQPSEQLR